MKLRWHLVAWVGLLAGLAVWMWPLDSSVSVFDMTGMTGFEPGAAGNTLDAVFSSQPIEGTAMLRLWIGAILIGGTVVTEIVLSWRRRQQRHDELPDVPSVAESGYSSGG